MWIRSASVGGSLPGRLDPKGQIQWLIKPVRMAACWRMATSRSARSAGRRFGGTYAITSSGAFRIVVKRKSQNGRTTRPHERAYELRSSARSITSWSTFRKKVAIMPSQRTGGRTGLPLHRMDPLNHDRTSCGRSTSDVGVALQETQVSCKRCLSRRHREGIFFIIAPDDSTPRERTP